MAERADGVGTLIEDAEESVARLDDRFGDLDDLEDGLESLSEGMEPGELRSTIEDLETLAEVAVEAEELLETIDLSELPEAIDGRQVLEAIEVGELPEAIAEGDADDAVDFRHLVRAISLTKLWSATDLRSFWNEKEEFEEAVDDLTDDEDGEAASEAGTEEGAEDEGLIDAAIDEVGSAVSGEDDEDEGMVAQATEGASEFADEFESGTKEAFGSAENALADGNLDEYQAIIQQQAMRGIDEFREALLVTHETFQRLYEYNRERMRRTDKSTHSRNPTAVSTMAIDRSDLGSGPRHSTVPRGVKYSTAPTRTRIYGGRFERELEKRRNEGRGDGDEGRGDEGRSGEGRSDEPTDGGDEETDRADASRGTEDGAAATAGGETGD